MNLWNFKICRKETKRLKRFYVFIFLCVFLFSKTVLSSYQHKQPAKNGKKKSDCLKKPTILNCSTFFFFIEIIFFFFPSPISEKWEIDKRIDKYNEQKEKGQRKTKRLTGEHLKGPSHEERMHCMSIYLLTITKKIPSTLQLLATQLPYKYERLTVA